MTARTKARPGHFGSAAAAAGVFALIGVLAGCATSGPTAGPGPFAGPGMETPPPAVMVFPDVIDGTVKEMGADEQGRQYFIFQASPDDEYCLMMLPQDDDGARACSGAFPIALTYDGTRAVLSEDPASPSESTTIVGEFVQVDR